MTDGERDAQQRLDLIKEILGEPVPRWFQNAHRRANAYAEQLSRIAEVVESSDD